jgi:hypothetical protein
MRLICLGAVISQVMFRFTARSRSPDHDCNRILDGMERVRG